MQESVFECRLSTGMRERLKKKLEKLEVETGFILIYRLYDKAKYTAIGKVPEDVTTAEEHAFVV